MRIGPWRTIDLVAVTVRCAGAIIIGATAGAIFGTVIGVRSAAERLRELSAGFEEDVLIAPTPSRGS